MSQALHETIEVPNAAFNTARINDHQYSPQSAQNQAMQGFSNFVDGSGLIFSMYLEMATEEDKKMAEDWKADADGILIFTGLFSAAVASLISVSIQDLQQNPQDTSNFYLANIYRNMADPNISSSLPTSPPPFSPPNYAVWVNALWFLSLAISLTCALLATFLQQWARRYLKVTYSRYSPHKRARIRAFFAEGVEKCLLPWAVDTLPTLLHISLFLFFAGLAVFLWNVNLTIFKLVLSWVGVCTALYGCITLMPIFRNDSPYYTSLSSSVWPIVTGLAFFVSLVSGLLLYVTVFCRHGGERLLKCAGHYCKLFSQGMQKTVVESALQSPPEIDTRAFLWTFDSLDEDHELERFFSGFPGFRSSKMVKDPLPDLTWEQEEKLLNALIGLSDRTLASDLLPEHVKNRRTAVCARAFNPTDFPTWRVLRRIILEDKYGPVQSAEIARLARGWGNHDDGATTAVMQALVSSIVARAQRRDDLWFAMASDEMGMPESILRHHAAHGDSLSLAILIHVTHQQFSCFQEEDWPWDLFGAVLLAASKFNVLDTSPELQHEFCALWNQVVRKVQDDRSVNMALYVLGRIRSVYVSLHQGTDSAPTRFSASTGDCDNILYYPSSYPLCNIPDHHPESSHIHEVSSPTTTAHPVPLDNTALVPVSSSSAPDAPCSSLSAALHVDDSKNRMDVPPLHNNIPASFNPTRQTAMDSPRVPTTSSDPPTAVRASQDIETSARTISSSTPVTSTTASFVPPIGAVSLQNNVVLLVHSDTPEASSAASPKPVFDGSTESHRSIPAANSSVTSPPPISAPTEGSSMAGSYKDKDTLDPPSVNRAIQANTVAVLDLPTQTPRLSSVADIAIAGTSRQDSDVR